MLDAHCTHKLEEHDGNAHVNDGENGVRLCFKCFEKWEFKCTIQPRKPTHHMVPLVLVCGDGRFTSLVTTLQDDNKR